MSAIQGVNIVVWALGIVTALIAVLVFVLSGSLLALRVAGAGAFLWAVCGRIDKGYEARAQLAELASLRVQMAALRGAK